MIKILIGLLAGIALVVLVVVGLWIRFQIKHGMGR